VKCATAFGATSSFGGVAVDRPTDCVFERVLATANDQVWHRPEHQSMAAGHFTLVG
jgi:hypothetical protein